MNGEWFAILLVSKENNSYLCARVEPNPIKVAWNDGVKISIRMCSPEADIFILEGTGFKPNEEIHFVSRCHDEKIDWTVHTDSSGNLIGMMAPAVIGKSGGVAFLDVSRTEINEKSTLKYYWGLEAVLHKR